MQNYITLELGTKGKEIFFGWTKDFCCLNIGSIEVSVLGSSYDFKQRGETPAHTAPAGLLLPLLNLLLSPNRFNSSKPVVMFESNFNICIFWENFTALNSFCVVILWQWRTI